MVEGEGVKIPPLLFQCLLQVLIFHYGDSKGPPLSMSDSSQNTFDLLYFTERIWTEKVPPFLFLCLVQVKVLWNPFFTGSEKFPHFFLFLCLVQVKVLWNPFFTGSEKVPPPPHFFLHLMWALIPLKGHTFWGGERMKKPNDQTPPTFPVLGDNFCKVSVYIKDLINWTVFKLARQRGTH